MGTGKKKRANIVKEIDDGKGEPDNRFGPIRLTFERTLGGISSNSKYSLTAPCTSHAGAFPFSVAGCNQKRKRKRKRGVEEE